MKKFLAILLSVVMTVACMGCLTACGEKKTYTIGLICLHDSDSTYDKNFIDAMKEAVKNKGVEDQLTIVTGIPEKNQCYETARDLVGQGCKVIFANSFGHEPFIAQAAKEFPNVQFCHATGTTAHTAGLSNFSNAFASIYEGRYLAGVAAGLKLVELYEANALKATNFTEDGAIKIGYVGAFTYAEVISGYTSFYLGVKSVLAEEDLDVYMEVQFTGSWYDEPAEKTAAQTLIANGAALISQHADSMGAPTACEDAGIPNVSYNGSTIASCEETFIISSRINWVPYFEYIIDCALNGTDIDTEYCGTLQNGSVAITAINEAVAAEGTQNILDQVKAELIEGTRQVFDVNTFTVTKTDTLNVNAEVDATGKLLGYMADVNSDAAFTADTQVVANGAFQESKYRSAPYFDIQIDGIKLLNAAF